MARKEAKDIVRERTIILALITQLFVAAFSAFLTFGLVGLYDPESVRSFPEADVAYVGPGGFLPYLRGADNLDVDEREFTEALIRFGDGRDEVVIEEVYNGTTGERTITLLLGQGEVQTTLIVTQIKDLLRQYERDLRVDRQERLNQEVVLVETEARPQVIYGFAFGVLLPLLVATPVFLSGSISGDAFAQEINTKTLLLLRASPLSTAELVIGKLLVPVLLAPAQVWLWIILLQANGLPVANVGWILIATAAWALLLGAAGLLIATVLPKEGQAQAAYTLLILAVAAIALLLPQDPFNMIARLGAGNPNIVTFASIAATSVLALVALAVAWWSAGRRFLRAGV